MGNLRLWEEVVDRLVEGEFTFVGGVVGGLTTDYADGHRFEGGPW